MTEPIQNEVNTTIEFNTSDHSNDDLNTADDERNFEEKGLNVLPGIVEPNMAYSLQTAEGDLKAKPNDPLVSTHNDDVLVPPLEEASTDRSKENVSTPLSVGENRTASYSEEKEDIIKEYHSHNESSSRGVQMSAESGIHSTTEPIINELASIDEPVTPKKLYSSCEDGSGMQSDQNTTVEVHAAEDDKRMDPVREVTEPVEMTTSASTGLSNEGRQLEEETAKVEDAIHSLNAPPLPLRSHLATELAIETPSRAPENEIEPSPANSQSPVSPTLPPRNLNKRKQYAVPPPFAEEMRSQKFRQNLAMTTGAPPVPPRSKGAAKANRLASAAEINLIANRLRQTSHHYQREDDVSREYLDKGKDMLKSSFSTFLESLPSTPTMTEQPFTKEEERGHIEDNDKHVVIDWEFWTRVVNDFQSVASEPETLEEKITDGIPSQIRGIIWQLVANSKSKEFEDIYETLSNTKSPHEASIRRDLRRTKFLPEDKVECLLRILTVYSIYDPDVGYTQGMAFIATPLILKCKTSAEALGLLIRLMKFYGLRDLFLPDMPGLMILLYQFDRLLEENSPQLYNHLARQGVRSSMYATQWFLTFFAYKFPLGFVLRIFDIVLIEGIESILRFAVNLMLKNSEALLALSFDRLLDYLKNELFNYYLKESIESRNHGTLSREGMAGSDDSDTGSVLKREITSVSQTQLTNTGSIAITDDDYDIELFVHEAMHDVHVTPISLKRYAAEYDEIHQIEQQKEAQYESIKIKNKQLQMEVRKLEHDYTLLNKEHVEIANELIKNRLKIETLLDENSDQKLIILELKKQLEEEMRRQALPNPDADIPSDIREDLDRTIRRNAEVMSENAKLQDKISEQERIISELKIANHGESRIPLLDSKPPLANSWSGFKKVFK